MGDIQFFRGYVNQQAADAGRFGQRAAAPSPQGPDATTPENAAAAPGENDSEFGFDDFLDIINPLQHIPVVSTLYRELTGDEISAPARIFGGTLFGGPSGFVSAVANTFFDEIAGADVGASVLAFFGGDGADDDPQFATPNSAPGSTDLSEEAISAAPLVTAASQTTADPTGPNGAGPATNLLIPAGLLPITTAPNVAPASDQKPAAESRVPAEPLQQSDGNSGVLTGQDALSALFNDLRGGAAAAPPASVPPPSMPAPALTGPTRDAQPARQISDNSKAASQVLNGRVESAASATTAPVPAVPDAALADQMLMALDKYQAMTRQRGLANPSLSQPDQPDPL